GLQAELWRSDGTNAGTQPIQQFKSDRDFSIPPGADANWTALNGALIFQTSVNGVNALRRYEPASGAITTLLPVAHILTDLTTVGSRVYFSNHDAPGIGPYGSLWFTDGTVAGTKPINLT